VGDNKELNIEIYTLEWCPYCQKAKNFFKSKGFSYQEYDIGEKEIKEEMKERTEGAQTVPQIFINDRLIGGYDDLMAQKHSGELFELPGLAAQTEIYNKNWDLIIIGAGPAGLNAALYGTRKGLDTVVVAEALGGQMLETGEIDNYLGLPGVEGAEMMELFWEHTDKYDVAFDLGEKITSLAKTEEGFIVKAASGVEIAGRAVIVASGTTNRELDVPGENDLKGKGVHYCATCDGHLYAGEKVAIIGGGNSGLEAALDLTKLDCQVVLVEYLDHLTGDQLLVDNVRNNEKIEVFTSHGVEEIKGKDKVDKVVLSHAEKDSKKELSVEAVFVEIGLIPNTDFIEDRVELNKIGEIVINQKNETSLPGLWAAGDVSNIKDKQVVIAAAEGAKAALRVNEYLC